MSETLPKVYQDSAESLTQSPSQTIQRHNVPDEEQKKAQGEKDSKIDNPPVNIEDKSIAFSSIESLPGKLSFAPSEKSKAQGEKDPKIDQLLVPVNIEDKNDKSLAISSIESLAGKSSLAPSTRDLNASENLLIQIPIPVKNSFNWEVDDDVVPEMKKKPTRFNGCLSAIRAWPYFLRTILTIFLGVFIFMIPGLISYLYCLPLSARDNYRVLGWAAYLERDTCGFAIGTAPGRVPVFVLMIWLTMSWTFYFGNKYLLSILPHGLMRLAHLLVRYTIEDEAIIDKVDLATDYIVHLQFYIHMFLWTIVNNFCWAICFMTNVTPFVGPGYNWDGNDWRNTIQRILSSFMFGFFLLLIEKIILQFISIGFHERAYLGQITEYDRAIKVLERINKFRKKQRKGKYEKATFIPIDSPNCIMPGSPIPPIPPTAPEPSLEKKKEGLAKYVKYINGPTIGGLFRSTDDAKVLAKKLWKALSRGGPADTLNVTHFLPFFQNEAQARSALGIFDKDSNGDVNRAEFRETIVSIFNQGEKIQLNIKQSSQAMEKLDSLFKVLMYIIILFIVLGIFEINTASFLAAAISIWLGLAFAIGGSIKNLVDSIVFLFVTHPYDIGDKVEINNNSYIIQKFGLVTTVLRETNGREIYAPNQYLATLMIHNAQRSGPTGEGINLRVAFNTDWNKIRELEAFLINYIQTEESREFSPDIKIKLTKIISKQCLDCSIWLAHKSNWQDGGAKALRTNRFLLKVKEGIQKFEIELAEVAIRSVLV